MKDILITATGGKETFLFDQSYPYALQSEPVEIHTDTVVYENSSTAALARFMQIAELARNAEWQRCGLPIIWREDGVSDPHDGWYTIKSAEISEELLFSAYGEPKLDLELRTILKTSLGSMVDSKAVPNDANLGGTALAAYPMGLVNLYPFASWTFAGANGSISVVENPTGQLRGDLSSLVTLITQGRCKVADENAGGGTSTEVFWRDHRNINGYYRVSNDLVRYTIQEAAGVSPLVEAWDGIAGAWTTVGNYQLQVSNGSAVLPLQSVIFNTISPEEIIWTERRFDVVGTGLVLVQNRIRRGSRLIESSIVAASGAGLTGTQSVALVNAPNVTWTLATAADTTGSAIGSVYLADGFETAGATINYFQGIGTSANEAAASIIDFVQLRGAWTKAANIVTAPVTAGMNQMVVGSAGPIVGGLDMAQYVYQQRWATAQIGCGTIAYVQSLDNCYVLRAEGVNTIRMYKLVAGVLTALAAAQAFTWAAGSPLWLKIDLTVAGTITYSAATDTAGAPNAFTNFSIADATWAAGGFGLYNDGTGTAPTAGGAFANVCRIQGDGKGWAIGAYDAAVTYDALFYPAFTAPYAGSICFRVFIPAAGNADSGHKAMFQHTTAVPNAPVTWSAWANVPNGGAWAAGMAGGPSALVGTGAWQRGSGTTTPAANANFTFRAGVAGTSSFDNAIVAQSRVLPGFAYLTANPNAASAAGQAIYSGLTVPAGTVTRLGIVCGVADDQYVSLLTTAAYAQRMAAYGRSRVRQRLLVGS